MTEPVEFLDLDDLIALATRLLGEPPPIRDVGLLGSAATRPQTRAFGEDAYPDLRTKAAALPQSIVKNHPRVDGNKRLGWLATAVFLHLNGKPAEQADNEMVATIRETFGTLFDQREDTPLSAGAWMARAPPDRATCGRPGDRRARRLGDPTSPGAGGLPQRQAQGGG